MNVASMEMLEQRIRSIETVYIGKDFHNIQDPSTVLDRLVVVKEKLDSISNQVPEIDECQNLLKTLYPYLRAGRTNMQLIEYRTSELLKNKEELKGYFDQLKEIQRLSPYIDSKEIEAICMEKERVMKIENELAKLKAESEAQSKEINDFLDIYETAMIQLSEICQCWENRFSKNN